MIQCDCQENIERICKNMCQKDYNKKIEKKKYQHLNYVAIYNCYNVGNIELQNFVNCGIINT